LGRESAATAGGREGRGGLGQELITPLQVDASIGFDQVRTFELLMCCILCYGSVGLCLYTLLCAHTCTAIQRPSHGLVLSVNTPALFYGSFTQTPPLCLHCSCICVLLLSGWRTGPVPRRTEGDDLPTAALP
jgi:hypothetical protein